MAFPTFSPGDVLNASDMNAVGLWLVKKQTIGSAVSSVTVSDVFSADYDNYRIVVSVNSASTAANLLITFGSTTTGYYYGVVGRSYANTDNSAGAANAASALFSSFGGSGGSVICDVFSPFAANETAYQTQTGMFATNGSQFQGSGYLNNTTSYTAFTLTTSTGTITGGDIRVYGYRN